jgi:hypothetical protein
MEFEAGSCIVERRLPPVSCPTRQLGAAVHRFIRQSLRRRTPLVMKATRVNTGVPANAPDKLEATRYAIEKWDITVRLALLKATEQPGFWFLLWWALSHR